MAFESNVVHNEWPHDISILANWLAILHAWLQHVSLYVAIEHKPIAYSYNYNEA